MNAPAAENSSICWLAAMLGDVDVARAIGGDAVRGRRAVRRPRPAILAWQLLVQAVSNWLAPSLTPQPASDEVDAPGGRELVDPVVVVIGDVDVARGIGGDAATGGASSRLKGVKAARRRRPRSRPGSCWCRSQHGWRRRQRPSRRP